MQNKEIYYFKLFRDVCRTINSTLNLKEVLNLIAENIVKVLDIKACAIFLLDKPQKRLDVGASYGLSETYLNKGPVDAEKSIVESLQGNFVLVHDATKDPRTQYPKENEKEGIASILSVPISVKGNVIGVLRIYTSQPRNFSEEENEFIAALAEMGGIAIENARMFHHLKSNHEKLINEVHEWFDFGKVQ